VIILLTDGENNAGEIPPITAAEIAKTFGIRVYTIGVGTIGTAPYPMQTPFGIQVQNIPVKIDEESLQSIAGLTGGKYFRATSNDKLKQIYAEIDALEKSKIEVKEFSKKQEEFQPFAIAAALLLIAGILFKVTYSAIFLKNFYYGNVQIRKPKLSVGLVIIPVLIAIFIYFRIQRKKA
jgi:Ca-activated chloride channel family protein